VVVTSVHDMNNSIKTAEICYRHCYITQNLTRYAY